MEDSTVIFNKSKITSHAIEFCPDHTIPEKNGKNIRLCSRDRDCVKGYKCTSTVQKHFGVNIKYCCQTRGLTFLLKHH